MARAENLRQKRPLTFFPGSDPDRVFSKGSSTNTSLSNEAVADHAGGSAFGGFDPTLKVRDQLVIVKSSPFIKYKRRFCRNVGGETIIAEEDDA